MYLLVLSAITAIVSLLAEYVVDIWPYGRKSLPIWPSVSICKAPLLLGLLIRYSVSVILVSVVVGVWLGSGERDLRGLAVATSASVVLGAGIAGGRNVVLRMVTAAISTGEGLSPLVRRALQVNDLWLGCLKDDLLHREWLALRKYANDRDSQAHIIVIYEELKYQIVSHYYRGHGRRRCLTTGAPLWLYYGELGGDRNAARAEVLVNLFGFACVDQRVLELKNNLNPSDESRAILPRINGSGYLDNRVTPKGLREWSDKPALAEKIKTGHPRRKCDDQILSLLKKISG